MKHKWHKEIKAWADGAEIEVWDSDIQEFVFTPQPNWHRPLAEFRIKEESEYSEHGWQIDEIDENGFYHWKKIKPQPKEPQYFYVWKNHKGEIRLFGDGLNELPIEYKYIGKLKLETEDE